ncbi:F0F1 ATP synthase subunit A [Paenibacillus sp. CECT 9249]|uniref:F0F1 ATP synthase subunit A n=1 Tax=Paenibacillus sp. CECT 9249 TaxID=2845385 RepID=UPI001E425015|nr:F0F1 ATP synthase subunit A [Paenibacillus sp. CECT 9249]
MHDAPIINVAGIDIDLSIVIMLIVTCTIVFVFAKLATRNLSVDNPSKLQSFLEWGADFIKDMVSSTMDFKKGKVFVSLGMTIILFVFVGNLLGIPFSIVTEGHDPQTILGQEIKATSQERMDELAAKGKEPHYELVWWKSPTADMSVTMGLAFMVFVLVHFLGMTRNTKAYFKHYLEPSPLFFPIHLVEVFTKLVTHGMRLFGNVFAKEVLMTVLVSAGIAAIPGIIIWQAFGLFISGIQAFVFTILTMVYLSQALESHDDH